MLVLILSKDNTIKIAAEKVTEDDAAIYSEDFPEMHFPERKRHAAIVKCIRNAVGKSTDDE